MAGVAAIVCGLGAALGAGGCSFQLHSVLASDEADAEPTGSIGGAADKSRRGEIVPPSETDLAYARAAASAVFARSGKDGKDNSVPWQNPNTGAGGNITPLATSYREGGLPCRDFLASYVHAGVQDWLQGAACRSGLGTWEVKSLKPLKQS